MSIFQRGEEQTNSSVTQGTGSFSSTASENSLSDMYRSPPRPLPYDAETRYFRLQRDGLVSRREKGTSHSQEESNPLRMSDSDADSEPLVAADKWNESKLEEGSKEYDSKSAVRLSMGRMSGAGFAHIYSSSEDEDVCPTCLEGILQSTNLFNSNSLSKLRCNCKPVPNHCLRIHCWIFLIELELIRIVKILTTFFCYWFCNCLYFYLII